MSTGSRAVSLWQRFRALPRRTKWIVYAVLAAILLVIILIPKGPAADSTQSLRAVNLRSVGELSLGTGSGSIFGTVRSVSEANIVAQSGGTVEAVHTALGASVPAGFVIAELENDSESASVLQAQGVYEAALAARQGQNVGDDEESAEASARSAYSSIDTALEVYVDTVFSGTAGDPNLTISVGGWESSLENTRAKLSADMTAWRRDIDAGATPATLLSTGERVAANASEFLNELGRLASRPNSGASATQLEAITAARTSVNAAASSITTAQATFRSGSIGATAGSDAAVKQALGTLRLAEAALERTRVRAPIAGTVNYLPLRAGDYVAQGTHAATVARNEALEIVAFVSEETREALATGDKVVVDGATDGVITSIAPALDPVTKRIEVRVSVNTDTKLTNGASVRVEIPSLKKDGESVATGPLTLPLSAVKLRADDRVVFGVNEESRLVAYLVETGDVHGDRIEITTDLPLALSIITDARGLSEGQEIRVAN